MPFFKTGQAVLSGFRGWRWNAFGNGCCIFANLSLWECTFLPPFVCRLFDHLRFDLQTRRTSVLSVCRPTMHPKVLRIYHQQDLFQSWCQEQSDGASSAASTCWIAYLKESSCEPICIGGNRHAQEGWGGQDSHDLVVKATRHFKGKDGTSKCIHNFADRDGSEATREQSMRNIQSTPQPKQNLRWLTDDWHTLHNGLRFHRDRRLQTERVLDLGFQVHSLP